MIKISAIVLSNNKEDIIEGCLKSISWVDEILLVDIGIRDKTLKIAEKYGVRVIKGAGQYDFSLWRNQGAAAAKSNWLFYVDTDERVSLALAKEISSKVHQVHKVQKVNGYKIPRKNYFWGKEFKSEWPDWQLRLMKKKSLVAWQGKLHETPKIKGTVGELQNPLIHLSHRSLKSSLENTLNWSKLEAEARLKSGHPKMTGLRFLRVIITGFYQEFLKRKIWKEGVEGFIEGIYQVFSLFLTYVRLWELQRKELLKETYKKLDKKDL